MIQILKEISSDYVFNKEKFDLIEFHSLDNFLSEKFENQKELKIVNLFDYVCSNPAKGNFTSKTLPG